ncbi:MAG: hypothetical protein SGCHY_003273 [Lobulomycetales sp.]
MKEEVTAATDFLMQYLSKQPRAKDIRGWISGALTKRYKGHWNPEKAIQGNGYRALNFLNGSVDAILEQVSKKYKIKDIHMLFPLELVLWVDPGEVSYRVGDFGYPTVIYETSARDSAVEDVHGTDSNSSTVGSPVMNRALWHSNMGGEAMLFLLSVSIAAGLLFAMVYFIIMFSDLECDYVNPIDLCNRHLPRC